MAGLRIVVLNDFKTTADLLGAKVEHPSHRACAKKRVSEQIGDRTCTATDHGPLWRRTYSPGTLRCRCWTMETGVLYLRFLSRGVRSNVHLVNSFRKLRRATYEGFSDKACKSYEASLENRSAVLVSQLLQAPEEWGSGFARYAASIVLGTVYGWPPIDAAADPVVERIASYFHMLSTCQVPGTYLVDIFPSMLYIPSWLAKWKRDGERWFRIASDMFEEFYDDVQTKTVCIKYHVRETGQDSSNFSAEKAYRRALLRVHSDQEHGQGQTQQVRSSMARRVHVVSSTYGPPLCLNL